MALRMSAPDDAYHALCAWTLSLRDEAFVHQHVVDAHTAQTAGPAQQGIGLTFALVGLHLYCERDFDGRAVQRVHALLARRGRDWPAFPLPAERGALRAGDVLAAPAGEPRERAIRSWCANVWRAYGDAHAGVAALLREHDIG